MKRFVIEKYLKTCKVPAVLAICFLAIGLFALGCSDHDGGTETTTNTTEAANPNNDPLILKASVQGFVVSALGKPLSGLQASMTYDKNADGTPETNISTTDAAGHYNFQGVPVSGSQDNSGTSYSITINDPTAAYVTTWTMVTLVYQDLVDDAHGFGTMGKTGAGTGEHFGVQDEIDLYFSTFAKSMAGIGAFIAAKEDVVNFLRYNMRSQTFAKSLPMPMVLGAMKRLELIRTKPELREKLWTVVRALQAGFRSKGFNIGNTESPVTPVFLSGSVPEATNVVIDLRENYKIFCSIVIYPVVPKDVIMLRIIPTSAHTLEDVNYTINAFAEVQEKLRAGEYKADKIASILG